jgi:hypothetical protein
VERAGPGQERETGWLAFDDVKKDSDMRKLSCYDAAYFDGSLRPGSKMEGVLADPKAEVTPAAYYMFRGVFSSPRHMKKAFYGCKIRFDVTVNAAARGWISAEIVKYAVLAGFFVLHAPIVVHLIKMKTRERKEGPRLEADALRRWAAYETTGQLP